MGEVGAFDLVPLQGSYVAKRCPVVAQLTYDDSLGVDEVPMTEAEQARADAGTVFEREIFAIITGLHTTSTVVVDERSRAARQRATLLAMGSRASVVLGGWLPDDLIGRRTGLPDVLVRLEDGWVPIDIKHHGVLTPAAKGSELCSELTALHPDRAVTLNNVEPSVNALKDVVQLAHYRRLLECVGLATGRAWGGIIGRDGTVWWCDLDEPRWRRGHRSALDIYDHEFDLRLRVIARQIVRNDDPALPPLVIPLRKAECGGCSWRQVCNEELHARDSVSLLAGISWSAALRLTQHGVATREDLASLDWLTANVACGDSASAFRVDLEEVFAECSGLPPSTGLGDALGRRKRTRLARLESKGIATVGDLDLLDARTVDIAGLRVGYLPTLIDQARAAVAAQPLLRRGVNRVDVPRADVEIDVDMENDESGVYLWGVRVSRTGEASFSPSYLPFLSWDPLDVDVEAAVFGRFWTWMTELRDATLARSRSFAAYCYSPAENSQMMRIAGKTSASPTVDDVADFIASPHWVDLHTVVKAQIVTGSGFGLKKVAPLAGFGWQDDNPGGDQSTVWYQRAVHHPDVVVREENRARLLAYNGDDVEATAVIREWLSVARLPHIESFDRSRSS